MDEKRKHNKSKKTTDMDMLVSNCRLLEIDHGPDAWLAIQMWEVSALCRAVETAVPALDLLQARLEQGATIAFQDGRWGLFNTDGDGICSGRTIRQMLMNLIFIDC